MNDTQPKKMGDVREDGYVFISYKSIKKIDGTRCEQWLSPTNFHKFKIYTALNNAKRRAVDYSVPFKLDLDYLMSIFPDDYICPILGIKMEWNCDRKFAPSLDKIDHDKGYIYGNVAWISLHANRLKDNASIEQLEAVLDYMKHFKQEVD